MNLNPFSNIFNAAPTTTLPAAPTPAPANQTPPAAQVTPGNLPAAPEVVAQATPNTAPNGVVPGSEGLNTPAPAPAAPESPLDPFKTLWDTSPNAKETPNAPAVLDPAKLQELIGKADFSNTLTQENLDLIAQGGEGAVTAFTQSMNAVGQQVMLQSTLAADKMVRQAVEAATAAQAAQLPELLKQLNLKNTLQDSNPLYSDPAVKPVMDAVQAQLVTKFPDATPAQLAEMTQNFVKAMGSQLNPAQTPTANKNPDGSDQVNWDKFMTG